MYKLDNLLKRRVKRELKKLPMMKILLNQSTLPNQLSRKWSQNQPRNQSKLLQFKPKNNHGETLVKFKPLNKLINLYTMLSLLETLKLLTLYQTTSHLLKKTLLKVDTQQFFLQLLQNKNQCMLFMRISNISILFIPTPKVSDYSYKTQVLVWVK